MKKILCATDFSDPASAALAMATSLAASYGAELILFHAVSLPKDLPAKAYKLTPAELENELRADQRAHLEEIAKDIPEDVKVVFRVDVHSSWQGILDAADEAGVDLIVIGSHGVHGLEHVLGTTARAVVEHSKRPVLIVPSGSAS